ncbi:hypothetical protein B9Z19DRAFT_1066496 [Tuber borchii]|uniref:Uncharacterized protein n=1 Tax=Tuber borchii TaxID=42251 RepID=A0A2T6ZML2_TUBBO|nr:hypothetical protein B9Z19DRAFT_1066496 [Tuber borchii]
MPWHQEIVPSAKTSPRSQVEVSRIHSIQASHIQQHCPYFLYLYNSEKIFSTVRAIVKKGKEITPRCRAAIVTLRCLDIPMTFKKIEDITGVLTSTTASDIWRHALANARSACLAVTTTTALPTALPPTASLASLSGGHSATTLPAAALPGSVLSVLPPIGAPALASIPSSASSLISDKEFSLLELISASVLDSDSCSGRPHILSEGNKDRLVKLMKKDFVTWRMTLCDIRREASLSHERQSAEEIVTAASKIQSYNENCAEEESRLNTAWRASEEWEELQRRELLNAREARLLASLTGVKTKTTQSWRDFTNYE